MFYRIKKAWHYAQFNRSTKRILDTPPLKPVEAPLAIVSMVSNHDPQMYIVAAKALYARLGRGHFVTIVDANMPQRSRDLIRRHLGEVEFVHLESIDTGKCQRGGTWERVLYCVERSQREYVIQVDCDTLAFGPIPEVLDCVEHNRAFTLSAGSGKKPLAEWVDMGARTANNHITEEVEVRALEYPDAAQVQYIRGSSGFAGFARGGVSRAFVEDFHEKMQRIHGARWTEWGTEQVASNFAVANSPDSLPLPKPKYATYVGGPLPDGCSLLHFIGSYRFKGGLFAALANGVAAELTPRRS